MTCEELGQAAMMQSCSKLGWTEKRRRRRAAPSGPHPHQPQPQQEQQHKQQQQQQQHRVVSGMLPTLQALAGLSREGDAALPVRGVCLVPLEGNADAASHLQATLLEAYCREIGLRLLRLPERRLREAFGGEHADLRCLLVLGEQPFRIEAPA